MEKIKITRTLLDKEEYELTKEEVDAVHKHEQMVEYRSNELNRVNNSILKNCKILCSGYEIYPIPTYGWIDPVEKLCYNLEAMNYDFKKYGLRVTLAQSKEKFGTLRFYTDTTLRPAGIVGWLTKPFYFISDKLEKLDYGINYVTDEDGYYSFNLKEITEEQYNNDLNFNGIKVSGGIIKVKSRNDIVERSNTSNTYFLSENGKYYISIPVWHTPKKRPIYTKNRAFKVIYNFSNGIISFINSFYVETDIQSIMQRIFNNKVYELITNAENECNKRCHTCGVSFDDTYAPPCQMNSWILYLCERCATAHGGEYIKMPTNEKYKEGEKIK